MPKSLITPILLCLMRVSGAGAALGVNLLLAKFIDPEILGNIFAMISMAIICSMLPFLMIDAGVIRFLRTYSAEKNDDAMKAYLRFLLRIAKVMTLIICAIVIALGWFSYSSDNFRSFWQWLPLLPATLMFAWMRFRSQIANANGQVVYAAMGRSVIRPITFFIGLIALLITKIELNPFVVSLMFLVSICLAALVQHKLIAPLPSLKGPAEKFRLEWIRDGISVGLNLNFQEYLVDILIVIAAFSLSSPDLAILAIALRLAAFARYAVMAVDQSFRPKIAMCIAQNKAKKVKLKLRSSAKMRSVFVLVASCCVLGMITLIAYQMGGIFNKVHEVLPIILIEVWIFALIGSPQFILEQTKSATMLIPLTFGSILTLVLGIQIAGLMFGLSGVIWAISLILSIRLIVIFVLTYMRTPFNSSLLPIHFLKVSKHG